MQLNKQDLIQALKDNLIEIKGDFIISNYSIDSRILQNGDTFVALKGEQDGHNYLNMAISKGASSLIISEDFYLKNKIDFLNLIIVKDTLKALQSIAKFNREKFKDLNGKLIGVTGSVGKTTLKEMLSFILSLNNKVSATIGNFNNHIGLPISLSMISKDSKFGVYELGMSSAGEISLLSNILHPQIAVITEIAEAHSEFFIGTDTKSSLDLIADAKAEILDGMESGSAIFLNKDSTYFESIKKQAIEKNINVYSFSLKNSNADIFVKSCIFKNYGVQVVASIFDSEISYELKSIAQHNAGLSALALGIANKLGISINDIGEKFVNFKIPKGRGEISSIIFDNKNITLIDDAYNANPKSMNSAILSLKNVDDNKILILGDMLELGKSEIDEHTALSKSILELNNIKQVILVGNLMSYLAKEIKLNVKYFTNYEQALEYLKSIIEDKDLLFIKGSFGSNVHKISKHLQN